MGSCYAHSQACWNDKACLSHMMGIFTKHGEHQTPQKIQKIRKPIVRGDHERVMMFTFSPLSEKKIIFISFQ